MSQPVNQADPSCRNVNARTLWGNKTYTQMSKNFQLSQNSANVARARTLIIGLGCAKYKREFGDSGDTESYSRHDCIGKPDGRKKTHTGTSGTHKTLLKLTGISTGVIVEGFITGVFPPVLLAILFLILPYLLKALSSLLRDLQNPTGLVRDNQQGMQ
ncbi:1041_t:CDS:2, partial [Acaulospora colombiana]